MIRRLFLLGFLTAAILGVGGGVIIANTRRIADLEAVRESKTVIDHHYQAALIQLQHAQQLLFKHQAGFVVDIQEIVTAADSFFSEIRGVRDYYLSLRDLSPCARCHADPRAITDGEVEDLKAIILQGDEYKALLGMILNSSAPDRRQRMEREGSLIGSEIFGAMERARAAMHRMVDEVDKVTRAHVARAERTIIVTIVLVFVTLIVMLAFTIPFVAVSMRALVRGTEAVAAGDFTRRIAIPVHNEIGLLAERFNVMADAIEERERELKEINDNLENIVSLRTDELRRSNERLREIARDLEQANRDLALLDKMKSDFVAIASHELRTPLVSLIGYLELLKDDDQGGMTPDQKEFVNTAWRGAMRLATIVRDLLDASRLESGKLIARESSIDINQLAEEAIAEQQSFANLRSQAIVFSPGSALPPFVGDRSMLGRVFTNLINNAIKYTPNGGTITVTTAFHERPPSEADAGAPIPPWEWDGGAIEISVADNGIGIPAEARERIFQRFSEAGNVAFHSTGEFKFMGGGIGLGLSITKGIVEGHGGIVWAESPGRDEQAFPGSRFRILLPAGNLPASGEA